MAVVPGVVVVIVTVMVAVVAVVRIVGGSVRVVALRV